MLTIGKIFFERTQAESVQYFEFQDRLIHFFKEDFYLRVCFKKKIQNYIASEFTCKRDDDETYLILHNDNSFILDKKRHDINYNNDRIIWVKYSENENSYTIWAEPNVANQIL